MERKETDSRNAIPKSDKHDVKKIEETHPAALFRKYGRNYAMPMMTPFQKFIFLYVPGISLGSVLIFAHYMVYDYVTSEEYWEDMADSDRKPIYDEINFIKSLPRTSINYIENQFDLIKKKFSTK